MSRTRDRDLDCEPPPSPRGPGSASTSHGAAASGPPRTLSAADVVSPRKARAAASSSLPLASVVKVFTVAIRPNYPLPWQMGRQEQYTGSGFAIEGRRIITNAHVVSDYTTVRVMRHGGHTNFKAQVLHINHVCDLAMLTVEEDVFWEGLPPLAVVADVPQLDERVMVLGYPMGGDTISVTRGVVSRVTTLAYDASKYYPRSRPELLAVQIDAAINSGNSGGPVFCEDGRVAGVAFSGYAGSADNIGYIIPTTVLHAFLESIRTLGKSDVVCDMGLMYEPCENPCMQRVLKLDAPLSGVRVAKVDPLNPAFQKLEVDDVILEINGVKVANDGTICFRGDERVNFQHLITSNPLGKPLKIRLLRKGKQQTVEVEGKSNPELVQLYRAYGEMPSYLIVGGLVFTPITLGLISQAVDELDEDAWHATLQAKKMPDQQLIVLLSVLAHPLNHGYEARRMNLLKSVNDTPVLNMKHLKELVDKADSLLYFKLSNGTLMVLDKAECMSTEQDILQTYAVPAPFSADLDDESEGQAASASKGSAKRKASKTGSRGSSTAARRGKRAK